jgi:hypothetical protein
MSLTQVQNVIVAFVDGSRVGPAAVLAAEPVAAGVLLPAGVAALELALAVAGVELLAATGVLALLVHPVATRAATVTANIDIRAGRRTWLVPRSFIGLPP